MSDAIIQVAGLGKRYRLGARRHDTLRDHLAAALRAPLRWGRRPAGGDPADFWALRDVSFEVRRGEVLGIIGRNGAGKSTLLKILSRITEPTTGRVTLAGRVASLLEVGTGFHPELSGRENVFLNGAILGMSRAEIRRKFDEIVAFAGVEKFLDTPVKHYSSGMYVRLAFAVAAHLEPEILVVDEVLAVGDAAFQKKCLAKMQTVAETGRTVLFVSHNLGAVQSLCGRCVLLADGRLLFDGEPLACVNRYLGADLASVPTRVFAGADPAVRVDRAECVAGPAGPCLDVEVTVRTSRPRQVALEFILQSTAGIPVAFASAGTLDPASRLACAAGESQSRWRIDLGRIANGSYLLATQLVDPMVQTWARQELPSILEVHRVAQAPALRVLEEQWQAGYFELDLKRR